MTRIAIVGMACRYPDAASPAELWDNAIAARRAFRRIPDVRMRLEDYWDADPSTPDRFYARNAAVIEGYEFNRIAYKVAGSTYRSTDMTHWLALDVAAAALADAGFPMGEGLPRERTGVVVGNTLTGEFSRANQMRLRWPYVRRTLTDALKRRNWDDDQLAELIDNLEVSYKQPFPAVDEDTLAGALSNTIAGRICNHFDLKGGGFTVDGACSSSLLSVTTASRSLLDGDLDVAVAGGVDLSIDPFEIIGFAKTGALAKGEMRVYDRASSGFWPGEGSGMVVLMREQDAVSAGHRIYATIAGWGISSDGKGGITRPEVQGYRLALRRAYERAGFGIDTVSLFEGHGTGTKVGDETELRALTQARQMADPGAAPAVIGSVKAMIGHTKAAAGVAGLIKAAKAVHQQVLPPTIGCVEPHELLTREDSALRVLRKAEPWPVGVPVRAGITGMGFGGINTHVVLEGGDAPLKRRKRLDTRTAAVASSVQDAELLLIDGATPAELRERLTTLIDFLPTLTYAQLGDLAATLHQEQRDLPYRSAVVVTSPEDAERQLRRVAEAIDIGEQRLLTSDGRCFLGHVTGRSRIGFLFPGQGSGRGTSGGALRRRFAEVDDVYQRADLPVGGDLVATAVAQPRIVTGSLAGIQVLSVLGIEATVAVGHSLGEISALHWAGAFDDDTLLQMVRRRGRTMAERSASGTMASIVAGPDVAATLIGELPAVIAAYNGPNQVVVAGPVDVIQRVRAKAVDAGIGCVVLPVSHAFHSPLVAPAAADFGGQLTGFQFEPITRRVVSTVTGNVLPEDTDIPALLQRQITDPVLFTQAAGLAAKDVELFVEVGPGRVLSGLASAATEVPAVALDTDDESLSGLLRVVAAAYVVGAAGVHPALFQGRLIRPLSVGAEFTFFASPCESAPVDDLSHRGVAPAKPSVATVTPPPALPVEAPAGPATVQSTLDTLRQLASERAELPLEMVRSDSLLIDELHLSSITVGQVVNQVARQIGLSAVQAPTNFATATLAELAQALDELTANGVPDTPDPAAPVLGAGEWIRAFSVELEQQAPGQRLPIEEGGHWQLFGTPGHPLAEELRQELETVGAGGGVLVWLPTDCTEEQLEPALLAAQAAATGPRNGRFVLVQQGPGATGIAKTLKLEAPQLRVTVVNTPPGPGVVARVVDEVAATVSYLEAHYDDAGSRSVPVLRSVPKNPSQGESALDESDVLLVSGGGKGITAECALALAVDSGAALAVLGRSDPGDDAELAANLERMREAGVRLCYVRGDVADPAQVRSAVDEVTGKLGPVTAILHGAGRNEPAALTGLDMEAFRRTFAPKVDGARALLDAVDPGRLRLFVTFGSIIGRAGLRGEAHYATANDWLADLTREVAARHPGCRAHCLEWSVWSGVGMGERLSVVEGLRQGGITPVSADLGVDALRRLVADPRTPAVVVVSGRVQGLDTVRYEQRELPMLRFVERALVDYPGVELVTEVTLNAGSDLYLADHRLDDSLLFPAVFGMEAMAQVGAAVTGRADVPVIENAEFLRPIVIPPDGTTTIRVAAVVSDDDTVDVAIHSEETGFAVEHFRARLRYHGDEVPAGPPDQAEGLPPVLLDPAAELYPTVLFQGERFQRLRRFHRAAARDVDVEVAAVAGVQWFAGYLPDTLLLGDPGLRDALMHGNQVCVPHATLLPLGIDRLHPAGRRLSGDEVLRFAATERSQDGDTYVYDIALRDEAGQVVERWEGLRLRAVRKQDGRGPWAGPLLGPYLERVLGETYGSRLSVAVEPDAAPDGTAGSLETRRAGTALALGRALGRPVVIRYRPDGRPEVDGGLTVSASHGAGVTLVVAGAGVLACDIEAVAPRSAVDWTGLLGRQGTLADLVAAEVGEDADTAGTRVWAAVECLQKAGQAVDSPLTLLPPERGPWAVFTSGGLRIATLVTTLLGSREPVVCAVLGEGARR